MKRGYLSEYFVQVAAKRLTAVEANILYSNQHEYNGTAVLRRVLGECSPRRTFQTTFIYLNDANPDPIVERASMTWYDARELHPTRSECRLYFPTTNASLAAAAGDLLIIARRPDDTLLVVVAQGGSTIQSQIQWLFGAADVEQPDFFVKDQFDGEQDRLVFASRLILEQIGIEIEESDERYLDSMLQKFGSGFPATRIFSKFARDTLPEVAAADDPDAALMAWLEREELLFKTFEKHLIAERLQRGFADVDSFISVSLSVQNRRKARAGSALENHVEEILQAHKIRYARGKVTENNSKPDFIFPGIEQYHSPQFPLACLTMLGAKSTCKDRWRQVLAEADRIADKHLITLEPGISVTQTKEMANKHLQLVVPTSLHDSYAESQRDWLWTLGDFLETANARQAIS